MRAYQRQYAYDHSFNLRQQSGLNGATHRMMVTGNRNRAIDQVAYANDPVIENWFDPHGNQLRTGSTSLSNQWDVRNLLAQTTRLQSDGGLVRDCSVYGAPGRRSRKVTETADASGAITRIEEAVYFGKLEYRTTWTGSDLSNDGVTVVDGGNAIGPQTNLHSLRIGRRHMPVAQRDRFTVQDGQPVQEEHEHFVLSNNIESAQVSLLPNGQVKSYRGYYPYGGTAAQTGSTGTQRYGYSNQEKDQTGPIAYGYRSYLPNNFRWLSPDPSGRRGSGLNRYAMVAGNPISLRDARGLVSFWELAAHVFGYEISRNWFRNLTSGSGGTELTGDLATLIGAYSAGNVLGDPASAASYVQMHTSLETKKIDKGEWKRTYKATFGASGNRDIHIQRIDFSLNDTPIMSLFRLHTKQLNQNNQLVDWDSKTQTSQLIVNANGFSYTSHQDFPSEFNLIYYQEHGHDLKMGSFGSYGYQEKKYRNDMIHDYDLEHFMVKGASRANHLARNKWALDTYNPPVDLIPFADDDDIADTSEEDDDNFEEVANVDDLMDFLDNDQVGMGNMASLEIHADMRISFKQVQRILTSHGLAFEHLECRFCRGGIYSHSAVPQKWKMRPYHEPSYLDDSYSVKNHFGKFIEEDRE